MTFCLEIYFGNFGLCCTKEGGLNKLSATIGLGGGGGGGQEQVEHNYIHSTIYIQGLKNVS